MHQRWSMSPTWARRRLTAMVMQSPWMLMQRALPMTFSMSPTAMQASESDHAVARTAYHWRLCHSLLDSM